MKPFYTFLVILVMAGASPAQVYINFNYTIPPLPVANAGHDTVVTSGAAFMLHGSYSGGTAPFTCYWSPGIYLNDSTLLSPTAVLIQPVTFTFKVTDFHGCVATDQVQILILPVGINTFQPPAIHLYPNPGDGIYTLEGLTTKTSEILPVTLRNGPGKIVAQRMIKTDAGVAFIDFSEIPGGMYLMELNLKDRRMMFKVIIY